MDACDSWRKVFFSRWLDSLINLFRWRPILLVNFKQKTSQRLIVVPWMFVILKFIFRPHMEKGRVLPFEPPHAQHRACLHRNIQLSSRTLFKNNSPWRACRFSPQNRRRALAAAIAPTSSPEKRHFHASHQQTFCKVIWFYMNEIFSHEQGGRHKKWQSRRWGGQTWWGAKIQIRQMTCKKKRVIVRTRNIQRMFCFVRIPTGPRCEELSQPRLTWSSCCCVWKDLLCRLLLHNTMAAHWKTLIFSHSIWTNVPQLLVQVHILFGN